MNPQSKGSLYSCHYQCSIVEPNDSGRSRWYAVTSAEISEGSSKRSSASRVRRSCLRLRRASTAATAFFISGVFMEISSTLRYGKSFCVPLNGQVVCQQRENFGDTASYGNW